MSITSVHRGRIDARASRTVVLALTVLLAIAGLPAARSATEGSLRLAIATQLAKAESHARLGTPDHGARRALGALYVAAADGPLWSVKGRATTQALALLGILRDAQVYGLEPRDYEGEALSALARRADAAAGETPQAARLWAQFDVGLSVQALRLICNLHYGRIGARAAGFGLEQRRRALDLAQIVRSLARTDDPQATLASIEPPFHAYRLLERALATYRRLAAQDAALTVLPPLPHRAVRPGQAYRGASALRERLRVVGDLPAGADVHRDATASTVLDPELVSALKRFQQRHGLTVDGILGPATYRQLTTPFAVRVRQIELNLERWRWLPAIAAPLILVNIPQFHLYALRTSAQPDADTLQMDVIVGRTAAGAQTPAFITQMSYVVFRPYWNVPRSITVREMLPDIRAKPGFLAAQHLQIVRGESDAATAVAATADHLAELAAGRLRLRQLPGPDNALGLIEFGVPNRHDVLLHSTPAHWLFTRTRRAFSHGCIRVRDPVALARYALRDTPGDWNREKIEAAMNGADNQRVQLASPIPVMIVYQTAFAAGNGEVLFLDDLYGKDRRLERLLGLEPESLATVRRPRQARVWTAPRQVSRARAPGGAARRIVLEELSGCG